MLICQLQTPTPWLRLKRRKLNVLGVFWTSSGHLMYVQVTYYVQGVQAFHICLGHAFTALGNFIGKEKTLMLRIPSYRKLTRDVMVMLRKLTTPIFIF